MRGTRVWFGAVLVGAGLVTVVGPRRAEAQAVAFQPNVATIPDGLSLDALPAVSADRRYVRLSLNPSFQTVNGFTNVAIPFAVSGQGSGTGAGAAAGALGGAGFPGAGGFRSVGVPLGMNGPVAANGMGSNLAAGEANLGYFSGDEAYATDDGSWTPPPRRVKAARPKSARAKKPAVAAGQPDPRRAVGDRAKP